MSRAGAGGGLLEVLGLVPVPSAAHTGHPLQEGAGQAQAGPGEEDGPAVRARLGVVPQQDNLDEELTARENILIYGRYFGLPYSYLRPKAEELLAFAQLTEKADAKVTDLSGGMKRRLVIARAIAVNPEVILMDEPCSALDPIATAQVEELIDELRSQFSVVIVTHSMQQAARVSQKTAFFHQR